jgi:hypothetical protein
MGPDKNATGADSKHYGYPRHRLAVRIMHWVNVLAVTVLLMSGLQIFNAHAALYWGQSSYSGHPPRSCKSPRCRRATAARLG